LVFEELQAGMEMSEDVKGILIGAAIVVLSVVGLYILNGCASTGIISKPVGGEDMVRVLETDADITGGWRGVTGAGGNMGSCSVETAGQCIPGVTMRYQGKHCAMDYKAPEHCPVIEGGNGKE
jgi:hypothetical protein